MYLTTSTSLLSIIPCMCVCLCRYCERVENQIVKKYWIFPFNFLLKWAMNFIFIIISFFHHLFMDFIAAPFHLLPSLALALSPPIHVSYFISHCCLQRRRGEGEIKTPHVFGGTGKSVEKRKGIKLSFNFTQSFFMCANNNIALLDNFMSFLAWQEILWQWAGSMGLSPDAFFFWRKEREELEIESANDPWKIAATHKEQQQQNFC